MNLFGRSWSKPPAVDKTGGNAHKNPISDIIDGVHVDDKWGWISDTIAYGLKARDIMAGRVGSEMAGSRETFSTEYRNKVRRNLNYYFDLRRALMEAGAQLGSGGMATNYLLQNIRNKYAMLLEHQANWRYTPGKPENTNFVHALNHIKNVEIDRQGYNLARLEAIAQVEAFGTALVMFEHTKTRREPHGDDYFYCADPLGFLVDFGARHINQDDPFSSRTLVVVKFRNKKELEREYGKTIDDGPSQIDYNQFSIWHNVLGVADETEMNGMMNGKVEEVTIYLRDESTEPIYEDVPVMLPVIDYTQSPPVQTGEEPDVDTETGVPKTTKEKTKRRRMVYQDYRKIVFSRNTFLYDDLLPERHGFIPGAILKNTDCGIGAFGVSDIELGKDDQINLSELQNAINDSVKQMPGIVLINEKYITNSEKPFERNQDGWLVIKVDKLRPGASLGDIIEFKQPNSISQDQLQHFANSVQNLHDVIGSQQESFGVSSSADSGVKNEGQDQRVLRFHNPFYAQEVRMLKQFAIMWLSNLLQYGHKKRDFAIVTPAGKPALQELYSSLPELREAAYFGIEVVPHSNVSSGSEMALKQLVELKGVLGVDLPSNVILRYSQFPELAEIAEAQNQKREEVIKLIQRLEQTGQLDQLLNTISMGKPPSNGSAGSR